MLGEIVRVVAGLAVTLGLIGLAVVVLRRFGPETLARLQGARAERRLSVIETLVLDPTRRLVLVRCDGAERLILLGEGQLIPQQPAPSEPAAQEPAR
jgi:flagellar protein FliO/FliZ